VTSCTPNTRAPVLGLAVCLATLASHPAAAQQTRAEQFQQQRQEKTTRLQPYTRSRVESFLFTLEDTLLLERVFNPPRGAFLRVGGLAEGAGFGAGPAYRASTPERVFTASSAISTRGYWLAEATFVTPRRGRWFAELRARRRELPQEDFFGSGPHSTSNSRTNFALRDTALGGVAGVRIASWMTAGGRLEHLAPRVGRGTDGRFPSSDRLFVEATAPGLSVQPDFLRVESFVRIESTDQPLNPRSGGRYLISYQRYNDRDFDRYSFDRWEIDVQQFVPFLHGHRMLVLRGLLSTSDPKATHEVPFYLQPTLGGAYSLRGFRAYRFRDRNLLLLQAEYRWEVNPFVTGALFYDAGTVAARRGDLDVTDLKRDYGFGLRLGSAAGVALRMDIAAGSGEGARLVVRFDDVF